MAAVSGISVRKLDEGEGVFFVTQSPTALLLNFSPPDCTWTRIDRDLLLDMVSQIAEARGLTLIVEDGDAS